MTPPKPLGVSNVLKYGGFAVAARLVPRLPSVTAYTLAAAIADLVRQVTPGRRQNVVDNLRHILGPDATTAVLKAHTRSVYRNVARYYVDLLRLPTIDARRFDRERVRHRGLEYLLEAHAEGHGVIVATAHIGCPDLLTMTAAVLDLCLFVLTEPLDPPALSDLFVRLRGSHGHRFVPVSLSAIKEAVRTLRGGGIVVLASDRDIQGNGVEAPFFGALAQLPTGAVELARRTGAPVLPVFAKRHAEMRLDLLVEPRLTLQRTTDRRDDTRANVAQFVSRLEAHLRQAPGQWLVLERIWRRPARR